TGPLRDNERSSVMEEKGVETLAVETDAAGSLDLGILLAQLGKRQISSLLVEGGAGVITSFVRAGLFDRMIVITAPRILGRGIEAVGDLGITRMDDSIDLRCERILRKGKDVVMYMRKEVG
ncbi:MAG: dihydrofolate reductase family protein, partial [Deltaproteobacteria bacterium]|nr:dihydrofolate reductase family protein [Deltaproteobacteria bacterium]